MHCSQADGRRIHESQARIAELEEQVIKTIEDRDSVHIHATAVDNSTISTATWQDTGFDPTGWELALVAAPSNNTNSLAVTNNLVGLFYQSNLRYHYCLQGGGFDKLTLESLYDEGTYRQI
ncbi:hypothetical protein PR202_gb05107 [Eleusine coracana subsp. coracana]|uniref:Uncharacterized protein n=1 Tax=Eleusine coracana subsp. coracana TaxID=191504 RepID=A0AAV5E675_ELECO|nr:hypothetical protein PR202_gb05107 [Eleusine coracana subsp. coracana]